MAAVALSSLHFRPGPGLPAASPEASDPRPPLTWPRSILFNPDGCCLYSGCQDSLRVYGWEPERCFDVVLVHWGKVADLAICNDQLVREPPPTLHPCARLPASSPAGPQLPQGPTEGPAPAPPFPADRRGLLSEQRLLLRGGPDAGHQDRHGGPGPGAGQPASGAAAAPPQRPPSPHLRAAQHRLQQASEVGCSGLQRALGGTGGGPPGLTTRTPRPRLPLLGRPPRVKQNSESERRSPSSEDDRDERESRAEIQNAEDYNEIFQPKNSISEALPSLPIPA